MARLSAFSILCWKMCWIVDTDQDLLHSWRFKTEIWEDRLKNSMTSTISNEFKLNFLTYFFCIFRVVACEPPSDLPTTMLSSRDGGWLGFIIICLEDLEWWLCLAVAFSRLLVTRKMLMLSAIYEMKLSYNQRIENPPWLLKGSTIRFPHSTINKWIETCERTRGIDWLRAGHAEPTMLSRNAIKWGNLISDVPLYCCCFWHFWI